LANGRRLRTAAGGVSLDSPFDLIEGHPPVDFSKMSDAGWATLNPG
jgi:hypothetical protein